MLAIWIQLKETLAELDAEIRCNSFCDVHRHARLASLWSFDRRNSGKRQFIVHERIIGRKRRRKKTRPGKPWPPARSASASAIASIVKITARLENFISHQLRNSVVITSVGMLLTDRDLCKTLS